MTGALAARNSSPSPPFYSFPPPLCLSVLLLTHGRRARCVRTAFPAPLLSALAATPWLGNACCVVMFLHKKCCAMCVERCGLLVACCGHLAFLFKNKRREIGRAAAGCNTQNDACKAVAARCLPWSITPRNTDFSPLNTLLKTVIFLSILSHIMCTRSSIEL